MTREENRKKVLDKLQELGIGYDIYEHPPLDTIEIAQHYWKDIDAVHCKNLFFRNHKGKKHYLVISSNEHTSYLGKDLSYEDIVWLKDYLISAVAS